MKFSIKKIIICAGISLCSTIGIFSQTTYSGYFLENYDYRFQMNPAFGNEKGFVSFPAIGNLNINMHGNLHVKDVVYTLNGKTVLFTNPGISESEAMKKFSAKNRLGTNEKIDILSVGFKGIGGYNTISIGGVASVDASVPGSFFSLAKEGVTNDTYEIENMFANANAYAQIALNHSRDIRQVPGLRVGATIKALVGVGNFDFQFNDAKLMLGENEWIARTNAEVYASVGGFRYNMDHSDQTGKDYVSGGEIDKFKPQGFGLGLDLGAQYKWNDFQFSIAALDLGFMNWGKTQKASTDGTQIVNTNSFIFSADKENEHYFDKEWDRLTDDIAKLYQMSDVEEISSRTRALSTTLNFGVEYELPVYRRLHFGLLNSSKINGKYSWTQFRLSANICLVNFISADVNVVAGTYGIGFGWLFNLHTTGFNLFVGMDQTIGKLSKEGVPLNSNAALNLGINFPF